MVEFVHLHNHTEYSFLDGICKIVDDGKPGELIRLMAGYKMPALGLTDHGNMCGAIEFYSACNEVGIKPILGSEVYLSPGSRFDKKSVKGAESSFHLTLLAKNINGYKNLLKLLTLSYTEGFYYKPRIDKELLRLYGKDIICLSGCIHGEIPHTLLSTENIENAAKLVEEYKSIFGDDFYIELMNNDMPEQKRLIPLLVKLAKYTNTPIVATNDGHYLRKSDAYIHDVFLCIGTNAKVNDEKRLRFPTNEFYYRSPQEMVNLFSEFPDAIENTIEICKKCDDVNINLGEAVLPEFKTELPPEKMLRELCEVGAKNRYGGIPDEVKKRLEYELKIVNDKNLSSYFLIVYDFVKSAKEKRIPVGPGRGSGAGALISYLLGLTDVDPLKYGLLFERFLNPVRTTLPDLDIDFADYGREIVIDYIKNKYGVNNVAQIGTFTTIQAKLAVRDVGRVLDIPQSERDKIAKLIPFGLSIYEAIKSVAELGSLYETNKHIREWLDIAISIEGLKRQIGTHAAGIVITKDELTNYTHLVSTREGNFVTAYPDDVLLKLGLMKIDILGLRTLSIIEECEGLIKQKDDKFDPDKIPLDDKKTYKLLSDAKTMGVFHGESSGMRDLIRKLKPSKFDDIIAVLALHRPGPLGSGMVDEFIKCKHGEKVKYSHPSLEPILKETYGVMLYQEQVMKIAKVIANFSDSEADILRQAMGKKIPEEIEKLENDFIERAIKNNVPKHIAKKIFKDISHFGGYGFNKSHATAYAMITYRTAYLKANYSVEFFLALLNSEIKSQRTTTKKGEEEKMTTYIKDAQSFKIKVLPPHINKSGVYFTNDDGAIRFGLAGIKNVGEAAAESIVKAREYGEFKSLRDLLLRVPKITKRTIESLIKSGALDSLKPDEILPAKKRAELTWEMENKDKIFESTLFVDTIPDNILPWPEHAVLEYEREMIGYYLSGHPLLKYQNKLASCITHKTTELVEDGAEVLIGGIIMNLKKSISKKGNDFARFRLDDIEGEVEVYVPPQVYEMCKRKLANMNVVVVSGKVRCEEEYKEIISDKIYEINEAFSKKSHDAKGVYLKFSDIGVDNLFLQKLKSIFDRHEGNTRVYIKLINRDGDTKLIETEEFVSISSGFIHDIEKVLGENSLEFI